MTSKLIKSLCVIFFTQLSLSQNNLQFSRIVTESGNISCGSGCSSSSVTYTVPQGKVWKIEYITPTIDLQLFINGKSVSTARKEINTNNYNYAGISMYVDPRILAKITVLTLVHYINKFIFDRPMNKIKNQLI
jgi:hypothetical protein